MKSEYTYKSESRHVTLSLFFSAAIAWLFTITGLKFFEDYGFAVFVFIPFFVGLSVTLLVNNRKKTSIRKSFGQAITALLIYAIGLVIFAIDGIICIAMAFPFAVILAFIGVLVAQLFTGKKKESKAVLLIIIIIIPVLQGYENIIQSNPEVYAAKTEVEIQATRQEVWDQLISFSEIEPPTEFIFKTGVAYPIDANIEGQGVGAIRYCNFSTGSFVEPITTWDDPNLLAFDVRQQPIPMKELSPYGIDPAHLHGYFVSIKGQFHLTTLDNGNTLLEGTTWYYNNIKPEFYWKQWSAMIIHKIHLRVLNHIKENAENH